MKMKAEIKVTLLQAKNTKDGPQATRSLRRSEKHGTDSPFQPQKEQTLLSPYLGLLASGSVRWYISVV